MRHMLVDEAQAVERRLMKPPPPSDSPSPAGNLEALPWL